MEDFAPSQLPSQARRRSLRRLCLGAGACLVAWPAAAGRHAAKQGKGAPVRKVAARSRSAKAAAAAAAPLAAAEGRAASTAGSAPDPGRQRWQDTHLPPALLTTLAATGLPPDAYGLYCAPLVDAPPLFSLNADRPFVLASTAKVVTALAGLGILGADYRWRTRAYLQGPLRDGTLHGDLLIVGGGDARLDSADLQAWFERMQRAGLHRVAGNILLDRSAFQLSPADHSSTPEPGEHRPHHVRPDALSVEGGVMRVAVQATSGREAQVVVSPPLADLKLVNAVQTHGGCTASASVVHPASTERQLEVRGQWAPACGVRRIELAPMSSEELSVLGIGSLWRAVGGSLDGQVLDRTVTGRGGGLPSDAKGRLLSPWSVHTSAPLMDFVQQMNKVSHNVMARHLMLSLAPGFPRRPATLAAARGRLGEWLRQQGLGDGDIVMDNGSGLSRGERGRPQAFGALLRKALAMPDSKGFVLSLPIAGVDGTLSTRLQHTAARGQAYLKTGSLTDVRALAGYVRGTSGQWQVFAAFVNHPSAGSATKALDEVVDWVARNA